MVLLLVMWLTAGGQSTHGYQVTFASMRSCEAAKALLEREAVRLNSEVPVPLSNGYSMTQPPVRLSAVCVAT